MKRLLESTKTLIQRQIVYNEYFYEGIPFTKYQKFYFCTNENIKGYLDNEDFKNKDSALSVLASGDHLFNLIEKGIKNIDTFDTNLLTKYYVFGIRYAMILKYNYKEYLETLKVLIDDNTNIDTITSIINDLLPFMDKRHRTFWTEINDYNYKLQKKYNTNLNLFKLISLGTLDVNYITSRNSYLSDSNNYNNLRDNISKTNVTFKNIDAIKLPKVYDKMYDFMLLSNIPEYLGHYFYRYDFEEYVNSLKNMLTDKGILFYNYIHRYATNNFSRNKIFMYLNNNEHNLINSEIKVVDSLENKVVKDGIIILRKKDNKLF